MRRLKKLILPALLFLPSALSGYSREIKLDNREYDVAVNEDRKIIQVKAEPEKIEKLSSLTLLDHQKSLLEIGLHELDYEILEMAKGTILKSKDLSSRIKSIGDMFGAGISFPWKAIALMNSSSKVYALREVLPKRMAAKRYLDSIGDVESWDQKNLVEAYGNLKKLTALNISPLEKTYLSTRISFDERKLKID